MSTGDRASDHSVQSASATAGTRAASLVPAASFLGRDELRREVLAHLETSALVTLFGPGGVGKTKLALKIAKDVEDVAVVMLAEVSAAQGRQGILRQIVGAMSIVDHRRKDLDNLIVEHLVGRDALLVLDNCEHLVDDVAEVVAHLLAAAPSAGGRLRILATSRTYLAVSTEQVVQVPPLGAADALQLLTDRVAARGRDFGPRNGTPVWGALDGLVAWSGGLPLILELMAWWLDGLTPSALLQRLQQGRMALTTGSRIVSPPHHRALKTAFQWSADLCTPEQRRLWARISVFPGGFTLEAAEAVCGDTIIDHDDIATLLADLVHSSLLTLRPDGRYEQLQPLREYGKTLLTEFGEAELMREARLTFFEHLAARSAVTWFSRKEVAILRAIGADMPIYRDMLWHIPQDPGDVVTITRGMGLLNNLSRTRIHFFDSLLDEFCELYEVFLKLLPVVPSQERLGGSSMLGFIRLCQGAPDLAKAQLDHCFELLGDVPVPPPPVDFLHGAYLQLALGDPGFLPIMTRAADGFAAMGPDFDGDRTMVLLIRALGILLGPEKISEELSKRIAEECLADTKAHEAEWADAWACWAAATVALIFGSPYEAADQFQDALDRCIRIGDRWGTTWSDEAAAWAAARVLAIAPEESLFPLVSELIVLLGGCIALQEATGVNIVGLFGFRQQREFSIATAMHYLRIALARDPSLGQDAQEIYDRHYAEGTTLTPAAVHRLALAPRRPTTPISLPSLPATLTTLRPREREIAELVARGETNHDIANHLTVSVRTVESHLYRVYGKLGLTDQVDTNKRAALAAWITEQLRRADGL